MPLPSKVYSLMVAAFAAMGAALFGYDLAVISSVFVAPDFLRIAGNPNPTYQGFIVSSMLLGAVSGSMPTGLLADRYSRRVGIVFAASIFLLGGALQTGATGKEMILAGRFFAGFSIGGLATMAPLYQSEIAHPDQSGRLMSTFQFFIGVGAVVAGWIAYGAAQGKHFGTPLQWRLPLAFQMAPAIPLVFLTFFMPESPRWLMIKGREQEALETLAKLHAYGNVNDAFVLGEMAEMRSKLEEERSRPQGWSEIFGDRNNLRKIFMGIVVQFSVQMTGVSAIQYYSPQIFLGLGYGAQRTLLINAINNIVGLIGEVFCILLLDKTGRRAPMIWCNLGSALCFAVVTPLVRQFALGMGTTGQRIGAIAMFYLYNFIFSYGVGPLSWVYPVEIMNTAIRAKGSAITATASWLANFMIGQVSSIAFANIGWRYYLVFTVCGATNALVFWAFFPETGGRTLEEMDDFFNRGRLFIAFDKEATSGRSSKQVTEVVTDATARANENGSFNEDEKIMHSGAHLESV